MTLCPLCRAECPREEESKILIKQRAADGRSWAQTQVGLWHLNGSGGLPVDKWEALQWLELAAEKCYPRALYLLGEMYMEGLDDIIGQSDSRAMSLMKEAADLGYSSAQHRLAAMYLHCNSWTEDQQKAALHFTLT